VGVEAAALIQRMTSEQLELTSPAFKRKLKQGKGEVSKLRAETVMSVVVTGTGGGCDKNTCGEDSRIFLEKSPVASGPPSPHSKKTERQRKNQKQPAACNLILSAFITGNSSLEPLIEGLCAQIHVNLR